MALPLLPQLRSGCILWAVDEHRHLPVIRGGWGRPAYLIWDSLSGRSRSCAPDLSSLGSQGAQNPHQLRSSTTRPRVRTLLTVASKPSVFVASRLCAACKGSRSLVCQYVDQDASISPQCTDIHTYYAFMIQPKDSLTLLQFHSF